MKSELPHIIPMETCYIIAGVPFNRELAFERIGECRVIQHSDFLDACRDGELPNWCCDAQLTAEEVRHV